MKITMVTEARRLMRMARSRQRSLNKQIDALEKELLDRYNSHLSIDKIKNDKLNQITKQRDMWEQVIDWLDMQLTFLSTEQEECDGEHQESSIGESYQLTDQEKRELLSKLTPEMTREFSKAYADFIFRCEEIGIRVSGVSFYPEDKGKPQND